MREAAAILSEGLSEQLGWRMEAQTVLACPSSVPLLQPFFPTVALADHLDAWQQTPSGESYSEETANQRPRPSSPCRALLGSGHARCIFPSKHWLVLLHPRFRASQGLEGKFLET